MLRRCVLGQMVCPMVWNSRNETQREVMKMREVKVKQRGDNLCG